MHVKRKLDKDIYYLDHQYYLSPINFDVPTVKSLYNKAQYNENLDKTNETVVSLQISFDTAKN